MQIINGAELSIKSPFCSRFLNVLDMTDTTLIPLVLLSLTYSQLPL